MSQASSGFGQKFKKMSLFHASTPMLYPEICRLDAAGWQSRPLAGDNYGGDGGVRLYHDLGTAGQGFSYADELFIGAGYPAIGSPLTIESRITLTAASTEIYGAFGSKSGSHTFPESLDVNAPLNFVLFAHDADERYKVNWLTLEVEATHAVPEPTSLGLFFGLSVTGLTMAWRQKRKRQSRPPVSVP